MLKITIPDIELYDEKKEEFINLKGQTLCLEHSLVSISKWESKWKKSFLSIDNKTMSDEEMEDYIRFMTLTQNVNPEIYKYIPNSELEKIQNYIDDPMTATTFRDNKRSGPSRKIITAEEIYYQMIALQIPFECQKWHINRLLTLIRVCNELNNQKKMGKNDILRQNKSLNAARRKAMHTKG